MKVLSIHQPWATLLIIGAKKIETRSWQTSHRGLLGIHASQKFAPAAKYLCNQEPFKSALAAAGYTDWTQLPTGAIIGTVHEAPGDILPFWLQFLIRSPMIHPCHAPREPLWRLLLPCDQPRQCPLTVARSNRPRSLQYEHVT